MHTSKVNKTNASIIHKARKAITPSLVENFSHLKQTFENIDFHGMNRKSRKSTDVIAQLGDPLPLPYRTVSGQQHVKAEELELLELDPSPEPVRRRQVPLFNYKEREEPNTPSLPIWHQRSGDETETVLDSIERKLAELRTEYTDEDQSKLQDIELQLEHLLERKQERSIVQELERLQQLNSRLMRTKTKFPTPSQHTMTVAGVVAVVLILLGMVSMVLGSLSYDYCYYFC